MIKPGIVAFSPLNGAALQLPANPSVPVARIIQQELADVIWSKCGFKKNPTGGSLMDVGSDLGVQVPQKVAVVARERPAKNEPAESETSLEALIERVASGDRAAFRDVYDQTSRIVFSIVLRILRSRELAEDVTQECYVLLWQRADRFQSSRGTPLAWIASIARYRAIDRIRSDRARGVDTAASAQTSEFELENCLSQSDASGDPACQDGDGTIVNAMSVRKVLNELKPDHRRAILLAYRYGYTHEELAQAMDVPLGTAKSWVRRGLKSMKDGLET